MNLYIACHDHTLAQASAVLLQRHHKIVSTWHQNPLEPTRTLSEAERRRQAARDLEEIDQSGAVLIISGEEKYSGGKFFEAGYGLGKGKKVYFLGRRENLLLYSPGVEEWPKTLEEDSL